MTGRDRPLVGRSILVTRNPGDWPGLARRLESAGAQVLFRSPTIQVEAEDRSAVAAAVAGVDGYDWIAFTSGKGARFFAEALLAAGRSLPELRSRLAAVGPGTAEALRRLGRSPDLVPESSTGKGLGRDLAPRLAPGERVLVVRPEIAGSELAEAIAAADADCDSVAFYRSVSAPWVADLAESLARGLHDAIVLTAPSALRALLLAAGARRRGLLDALGRMRRIAIGETTARALEEAGLPAHAVAEAPTEEALGRVILEVLRAESGPPRVC